FAEAEIEPTQLDILAAGELRVDAEAAAEQRSDLPFDRDRAGFRYIDAGKDVQQGAFAGAVPADQADARPVLDGEIDAVERADIDAMACVSADAPRRGAASAASGHERHGAPLQRSAARIVDREIDGDIAEMHGCHR